MMTSTSRREFLKASAVAGASVGLSSLSNALGIADDRSQARLPDGKAKAMIMIYLPGGVTQQDTWDPKPFTPFTKGMKGSDLLATCRSIATSADGIRIGAGMERLAQLMDRAAIVRSLNTTARFGASHVKAQFYAMTGYLEPVGLKPPTVSARLFRNFLQ